MCCNGLAPLIERRRAQTCSIFVLLNIQGRVNLFLDVNGAEMRSDLCRRFKLLLMQEISVLRFGEQMSIRKRQSKPASTASCPIQRDCGNTTASGAYAVE